MILHGFPLGLGETLTTGSMIFLVVAIGLALAFEFVNGFHDTANAVATVIYTHTLPPYVAVIWSGICNLTGVLLSSGGVAYTVLALLPVELVINVGSGAGFAMIFALLISAIIWNVGTWYLGLPASSSHTLIGSILGVGLANAMLAGHSMSEGVNWDQVYKVFLSLLVSPIVGFVCAGGLLLVFKAFIKDQALFQPPPKDAPPPHWIRGLLILTCTGVSFAHGSNDGQKGMGLLLLILIGILPAEYALNLDAHKDEIDALRQSSAMVQPMLMKHAAADPSSAVAAATAELPPKTAMSPDQQVQANPLEHGNNAELSQYLQRSGTLTAKTYAAAAAVNHELAGMLAGKDTLNNVSIEQRKGLRTDLYLLDQTLSKIVKGKSLDTTDKAAATAFGTYQKQLDKTTKYLPTWVKFAVAIALGLGTMIGWKRIVTTVGEKIGKEHLNYGQGASAELVAMCTIGAADWFNLPVSTTHVLSSGVAGTMAANKSGLQAATMRNILLAWVLTLPVCVILGAMTFAGGLYIVFEGLVPEAALVAVALALVLIGRRVWISMSARNAMPAAGPTA